MFPVETVVCEDSIAHERPERLLAAGAEVVVFEIERENGLDVFGLDCDKTLNLVSMRGLLSMAWQYSRRPTSSSEEHLSEGIAQLVDSFLNLR